MPRGRVKVEPGDVVVVRNGDDAFRKAHPDWYPACRRIRHAPVVSRVVPEKDIAAISWDMMDERPTSYPGFAMSTHLAIPLFLGLVLVDNTNPERLARRARRKVRFEVFFTATPIRLAGSTVLAHPLAIF